MENSIALFIVIPLLGFMISLLVHSKKENAISVLSVSTLTLQLIGVITFSIYWLLYVQHSIDLKEFSVYKSFNYEFYISLYFDRIALVYLIIGVLLTLTITVYSRYYLHRESGYKRFFNVILLFRIQHCGLGRKLRNLVYRLGNSWNFFISVDCVLPRSLFTRQKCRQSIFDLSNWRCRIDFGDVVESSFVVDKYFVFKTQ